MQTAPSDGSAPALREYTDTGRVPVKKRTEKMTKLIFALLSMVLIVLIFFGAFSRNFIQMEMNNMQHYLETITQESSEELRETYSYRASSLENLANNILISGAMESDSVVQQLAYTSETNVFTSVGMVDTNGVGVDSFNREVNIASQECFRRAVRGEVNIHGIQDFQGDPTQQGQIMAVPLKSASGEIEGVVYGIWKLQTVSADSNANDIFGDNTYLHIIDHDGYFIYRSGHPDALTEGQNVWRDLKKVKIRGSSIEQIKKDLEEGKSGNFAFSVGDESRSTYYTPLGISDSYVFSTINDHNAQKHIDQIRTMVQQMLLGVTAAFLMLFVGLYLSKRNVQRTMAEAAEKTANSHALMWMALMYSDQVVFEYSIQQKELKVAVEGVSAALDDNYHDFPQRFIEHGFVHPDSAEDLRTAFDRISQEEAWETDLQLKNNSGEYQWYKLNLKNVYNSQHQIINTVGLVTNIDKQKCQEQQMEEYQWIRDSLTQESILTATVDLTSGTMLEINKQDLEKDTTYREFLREYMLDLIPEHDRKAVIWQMSERTLLSKFQRGERTVEIQFEMKQKEKRLVWASCTIHMIEDTKTNRVQAVMMLRDIDEKKRKELELRRQAERDDLTGLYNAAALKKKVSGFLQSDEVLQGKSFFIILDVDNFKRINDAFGHLHGDGVLKEVAAVLAGKFRGQDIVARLGGDEFAMLIINIEESVAIKRVEELCKELHRTYSVGGVDVTISASVGMVEVGDSGSSFETLYQIADQMLYEVKYHDKNSFKLYKRPDQV